MSDGAISAETTTDKPSRVDVVFKQDVPSGNGKRVKYAKGAKVTMTPASAQQWIAKGVAELAPTS